MTEDDIGNGDCNIESDLIAVRSDRDAIDDDGRLAVIGSDKHIHAMTSSHQMGKEAVGCDPRPDVAPRRVRRDEGRDTHQVDVTGEFPTLVSLTTASTSFRTKPYSASARIAMRLFSHSETSEPPIVTVACVDTS